MMRYIAYAMVVTMVSAGVLRTKAETPADTVVAPSSLHEIVVKGTGPRKVVRLLGNGEIDISSALLSEQPTILGSNDPLGLIRSLPAIATANELSASLSVKGMDNGANHFTTDGIRVVNPLHLFGLYSTFNPAYYKNYRFASDRFDATEQNFTGGRLEAESGQLPDTALTGTVAAGIIESHFAVAAPIVKGKSSLAVGVRQTYLNLLFPGLLKFNTSTLKYDFTDVNAGFRWQAGENDILGINFFFSRDGLNMSLDKRGEKNGECGWHNICGGAKWNHDNLEVNLGVSYFNNKFYLTEGGRTIDLPSNVLQGTLSAEKPLGDFTLESDITIRHSSGQYNRKNEQPEVHGASDAAEMNIAANWKHRLCDRLSVALGLRLSLYHCGSYNTVRPLPRVSLRGEIMHDLSVYASYGRLIQYEKLVEETTASLPADFRINADRRFKPQETHSFDIGAEGRIGALGIDYSLGAYYRLIRHAGEFHSSLLNLAGSSYNPLSDYPDGHGYSCGVSVMLMRQFGKFRGRAGYNLGKARLKFDKLGNDYFPSAHDRLHDLNASLSYEPAMGLTFVASFTHATGLPYTRTKYGYMIGDNLICEYYPHNSSRLPAYNRLDVSATYKFKKRGRTEHAINISLYNALFNKNILFYYTTYTEDKGIQNRSSYLETVIPSITYTLTFK